MSYSDVECPYCRAEQEIDHDDGYGYQEDVTYEQQCCNCDKYFAYTTAIIYHYESNKADCLNGGEHQLKKCRSYPEFMSKNYCVDCGYEENFYSDEERVEKWRQYEKEQEATK